MELDGAVVVVVEVVGVTVPPVSCCTSWRSDSMVLIVGLVGAQVAGLQVGQRLLVRGLGLVQKGPDLRATARR